MRRTALAFLFAAALAGAGAGTASAQSSRAEVQDAPVTVTVPQPNPIRSTGRFSVIARRATPVRVELLNLLGQRVATLFEGRLDAGESQPVTILTGDLPTGLYLYRVQAGASVVTRQVFISR